MNKKMNIKLLLRLQMQSERNAKKWRTNIWFLLHDKAPARRRVSATDFLAKNNVKTLEHP